MRPYPAGSSDGQWQLTNNGRSPIWDPSADEIYFVANGKDFMSVTYTAGEADFEAAAPRRLFEHAVWDNGFPGSQFDVSPDGQRFLVIDAPDLRNSKVVVVQNWFDELERLVPTD